MQIRAEEERDRAAVYKLNRAAFESDVEANLAVAVRLQADPHISLVAAEAGEIIGHIMFSPATLSADPELLAMGLGPMAVLPRRQREGIGSALVRAGLDDCRQLEVQAVFVLGHPQFYPRFGFVPASSYAISSTYDVPDEVFMALELKPGALSGKAGTMRYHRAFDEI